MGLWLKCPKCQAGNPLSLKACAACGASLDKLPEKQRIYVLATAGAPPPQPKAAAQEPAEGEATKAPAQIPGDVIEGQDLTKPPAKKAKGPRAGKKKR